LGLKMTLASDHYDFFGVSATYTPDGGADVSVTILIEENPDRVESGGSSRHEAQIMVQQSEISSRPGYRDKFTVGSQEWLIKPEGVKEIRELQDFAGEWQCAVFRDERPII